MFTWPVISCQYVISCLLCSLWYCIVDLIKLNGEGSRNNWSQSTHSSACSARISSVITSKTKVSKGFKDIRHVVGDDKIRVMKPIYSYYYMRGDDDMEDSSRECPFWSVSFSIMWIKFRQITVYLTMKNYFRRVYSFCGSPFKYIYVKKSFKCDKFMTQCF